MKKLFLSLSFLFASLSTQSNAQAVVIHQQVLPHFWHFGMWSGVPFGWGYIHHPHWPIGYWNQMNWNGFSYFNHFNQLPQYSTFGVISYSPSQDRWGVSWGHINRFQASVAANNYCGFGDCQPVVWTQGGCAAISTSASSKLVTWGVGHTIQAAEAGSLRACGQANPQGTDCVSRAYVCSY